MQNHLKNLENCALFEGIAATDLPTMLGCLGARTVEYQQDEVILHEGDPAVRMGIVLSGSARIVQNDFYGNRSIIATVRPAQLFGESFACANVRALPVSVICAEKSEIMFLDCHRVTMTCSNACAFHSHMILNLLRVVSGKNILLNQKIEIISRRTTREKLLAYLAVQAQQNHSREFTIPFDRQGLADYLCVERSALSAEISRLRKDGLLETDRSFFRLCKTR